MKICGVQILMLFLVSSVGYSYDRAIYGTFYGGGAYPRYFTEIQNEIDAVKAAGGSKQVPALDYGGAIYFPMGDKHTLAGAVVNFFSDSYSDNSANQTKTTLAELNYGPGLLYAFGSDYALGLLLRFELGASSLKKSQSCGVIQEDEEILNSPQPLSSRNDNSRKVLYRYYYPNFCS